MKSVKQFKAQMVSVRAEGRLLCWLERHALQLLGSKTAQLTCSSTVSMQRNQSRLLASVGWHIPGSGCNQISQMAKLLQICMQSHCLRQPDVLPSATHLVPPGRQPGLLQQPLSSTWTPWAGVPGTTACTAGGAGAPAYLTHCPAGCEPAAAEPPAS